MARAATAYPWGALSRLTRAHVEASQRARAQLAPRLDVAQVAATAAALLGVPVEVHVREVEAVASPVASRGVQVALASADGGAQLLIELESALAVRIAGAIAGKTTRHVDPTRAPAAEVVGAAAAFATLVARRCGGAWRLAEGPPRGAGAIARAVVLVDDEAFDASVLVPLAPTPPALPPFDRVALAALGDVPLRLQVVAAVGALTSAELDTLEVGAAWAPGAALTVRPDGGGWRGRAMLVGGTAERGLPIVIEPMAPGEPARVTLAEGSAMAPWDVAAYEVAESDDGGRDALRVVRAEIGAVTLPARAWSMLAAGDALDAGPLAACVTLRAGGVAFARGGFAVIGGDIVVRIRERAARRLGKACRRANEASTAHRL